MPRYRITLESWRGVRVVVDAFIYVVDAPTPKLAALKLARRASEPTTYLVRMRTGVMRTYHWDGRVLRPVPEED